MREVEILVELYSDIEIAMQALKEFEFHGSKETIDKYYFDPLRQNLKLNDSNKLMECCRLRTMNGRHYVTYKVDIYEQKQWKYSEEFETEVCDIQKMEKIFISLGLESLVTIHNVKHIFAHHQFEISLEEVKNLGSFLEIEYQSNDDSLSIDQMRGEINAFINLLNFKVGSELNSGKPELLLLKQQKLSAIIS